MKQLFIYTIVSFVLFSSLVTDLAAETVLKVYTRMGCPHCEDAKAFLKDYQKDKTDLKVEIIDVFSNVKSYDEVKAFADKYKIEDLAVPMFRVDERYHIGFGNPERMKVIIDNLIAGIETPKESQEQGKSWPMILVGLILISFFFLVVIFLLRLGK